MKKYFLILTMLTAILIISCSKNNENNEPENNVTAAISFEDITFDTTYAYFSTNGNMTAPVDSNQAKTKVNEIDITYIYNQTYAAPGFFDPIARSQHWAWDTYYLPWLNSAVETRYYSTGLTKTQFDEAKTDETKIADYFSDTSTVILAPHAIFPEGSCIGGKLSNNPSSIVLIKGKVYGFINTGSGKRGFLYIRTDQPSGWPHPLIGFDTKVDIIREN